VVMMVNSYEEGRIRMGGISCKMEVEESSRQLPQYDQYGSEGLSRSRSESSGCTRRRRAPKE